MRGLERTNKKIENKNPKQQESTEKAKKSLTDT